MVCHSTQEQVRDINRIILHCSATRPDQDIDAAEIRSWHLARGWDDIGYHYVIKLNGVIETGRPLDVIGAHVRGQNRDSIGICYVGGLNDDGNAFDTMTIRQVDSFKRLVYALCVTLNRKLWLHGHNEYSPKACPSFEVAEKFEELKHWACHYQQSFRDQRPPASLELTQYSSRTNCTCGYGEHYS